MLKSLILLSFIFLLGTIVYSQNSFYILKATVINDSTGLPVKKALMEVPEIDRVFTSDKEGRINLGLPEATYTMVITHADFQVKVFQFQIHKDTSMLINLVPLNLMLNISEAMITELRNQKINTLQAGVEKIRPSNINQVPAALGEADIIKNFSLLPGIQSTTEGSGDIIVRGGLPGQNLFLMDKTPIYHSSHLFGFVSSYNPMTIGSASLYKSTYPVRFGGRLSSLLDVETKYELPGKVKSTLDLGIISTKGRVEIPIIKDKWSIALAGRRTYFDLLLKMFQRSGDYASFNFYDAAITSVLKQKNHSLKMTFYTDKDRMYSFQKGIKKQNLSNFDLGWKNTLGSVQLTSKINEHVTNYFHGGLTAYTYTNNESQEASVAELSYNNQFYSGVTETSVSDELRYEKDKFEIGGGFSAMHRNTIPAEFTYSNNQSVISKKNLPNTSDFNVHFFADFTYAISSKNRMNVGLRNSNYTLATGNQTLCFEPRAMFIHTLDSNQSVKLGVGRTTQSIHLLSNTGLGLPSDIWITSNKNTPVEHAWQMSLGYYATEDIVNQPLFFSVEAYYKTMSNIVTYNDGYSTNNLVYQNALKYSEVEDMIISGKGLSYGIELLIEKKVGPLQGTLAYTISKTRHAFSELGQGKYFPAPYDRLHDFAINGSFQLNKRNRFVLTWVYATGQPVTLPISSYTGMDFDYRNGRPDFRTGALMPEYTERNTHRMQAYHRLDIGYNRDIKLFNRYNSTLKFSIYNVYNRKNPYYYNSKFQNIDGGEKGLKVKRAITAVSIFPIIPSVSYEISF